MIDPKYLINVDDPVLRLYEGLQADILMDIVRRIEKADYGITETAKWQIYKLQESGMLYAGILNNVARLSGKSEAEVKKIFEDAAIENLTDIKPDIDDPYQLINSNKSVLDRLLAGIERTNGELYNLTLSTAESAQSAFFNAVDRAYMQISSGAFDYNTAVYNAVKTVTDSGAPYVTYPSGRKNRIDVAVRRAVMTGVVSTANAVSLNLTKELGLDYVDISAHAGARPSHAVWQGKRYCVSGKDKRFPPLSETGYGSGDGLGGWNCRHSMHPTTADAPPYYSEEEFNRINSESVYYNGEKMSLYDATQEQRKMESSMRDTRVKLSAYGSMKDNPAAQAEFASLSVKLKEQEAEYRNFCRQTGLAEQNERLRVVGFNRSLSQKAVWANKKAKYAQSVRGLAAGTGKTGSPSERPAPTLLEIIDTSDKNLVKSILKKYERIISDSDTENAIVVTKDGKVYRTFGDKNHVYPDLDLNEELRGASVTHNHPVGSQNEYSFSGDDLALFENYELELLRGIDELFEYEMNRNGGAVDEFIEYMNNPDYNPDTDYRHDESIEYAKEHGYGYTRKKNEK